MAEEYIEVDENHRLGWGYDEAYGRSPRTEWEGHLTAVVDVNDINREWGNHRSDYEAPAALYEDEADVRRAHQELYRPRYTSREAGENHVLRWLKVFWGLAAQYDAEYGCYWVYSPEAHKKLMGDDALPTIAEQDKVIDQEREVYRQWAQGEVYYVFGQERRQEHITVKNADGSEVLREYDREDWETIDSIGGIYMDPESYGPTFEKMVFAVAADYFGDEYQKKEEVK